MTTTAVTFTNNTTEEIALTQMRGGAIVLPPASATVVDIQDDVEDASMPTRRDMHNSTQLRRLVDEGKVVVSPLGIFETEADVVQTEGLDALTTAEHALLNHSAQLGVPVDSDDLTNASGVTGADVTTALDALALGGGGFFADGGGTDAAIGKGATTPTAAGANAFAHGDTTVARTAQAVTIGKTVRILGSADCDNVFAHGETIGLTSGSNTANHGSILAQGKTITITHDSYYGLRCLLLQGEDITVPTSDSNLRQGFLLQGKSITALVYGSACFGQGLDIDVGIDSFCQGDNVKQISGSGRCLFQGEDISAGATSQSLFQGSSITHTGGGVNKLVQGAGHVLASGSNQFIQGASHNVPGSTDRIIVHGANGEASRDDQRAFTGNRLIAGKLAQWSFMPKHKKTTDRVKDTVFTFPLEEGFSYYAKAKLLGRNIDTAGEDVVFSLDDILLRRAVAGGAVIQGGDVALTKVTSSGQDAGPANAAFLAGIEVSTNDILVTVTPDPGDAVDDDYEWMLLWDFLEIEE